MGNSKVRRICLLRALGALGGYKIFFNRQGRQERKEIQESFSSALSAISAVNMNFAG
jgi:hypothetical protein